MRWLVTGGAGFIGSHIVAGLLARGDKVRVFDDLSTGRREKLDRLLRQVEFVAGDARDPDMARQACAGVEVVLHHAPGARVMLEAAREQGVRRFVFASSCAVYGNSTRLPCREEQTPAPVTPYGAAKLAGERSCREYADQGLETVVLRYFNVFGPRQDANSQYDAVIPGFIRMMLAGRAPVIFGDGRQARDFTPVERVVRANIAAGTGKTGGYLVCNVGTGRSHTLRFLARVIGCLTGRRLRPRFEPMRPVGLRHSVAAVDRLGACLGIADRVDLIGGLARMVDWCRAQPAEASG